MVSAGEVHGFLGPNGAGKTTYFNLISGQLKATAGSVTLKRVRPGSVRVATISPPCTAPSENLCPTTGS